jgi:hypothetical protein
MQQMQALAQSVEGAPRFQTEPIVVDRILYKLATISRNDRKLCTLFAIFDHF